MNEPKAETGNSKMEIGDSKIETRNSKLASWAATAGQRVSSFQFRVSSLAARLPWRLVLAAGCLVFLAIWLHEHDARLRRDLELKQLKQQTSAEVADLRARAEAAIREADQRSTRAVADLEARRRQLEREGGELQKRLTLLREQERQQVNEVAKLPLSELAERLKSRGSVLGLPPRGFGRRVGARDSACRPEALADGSGLGTRPAAQRLWPTGRGSGAESRMPGVGERESRERLTDRQSVSPQETRGLPDSRHLAPGIGSSPDSEFQIPNAEIRTMNPGPRVSSPEFVLTEQGARLVETAFVELDACREQSALKDGALENCQQQAAMSRAIAGEMSKSVNDLNQAIRLKDEIQARMEAQHRAELKAARGSRLRRFGRAVQYVGVGVVIGLVAR